MLNAVNGNKTYLIAIATLLYAVASVVLGKMPYADALNYVLASGALATLRHAISK